MEQKSLQHSIADSFVLSNVETQGWTICVQQKQLPIFNSFCIFVENYTTMNFRIGHGYDLHRLVDGRRLILGGVDIPYSKGLLGHSDADVAVHALMDALLGALALGDIGKHFPDSDSAYKDISSILLLKKVGEIISRENYLLSNADVTIIAQKPKLLPYIPEMRKNIADTLGCDISQISIKATTEEGLGFTGSGEAISAHAVCILQRV